MRNDAEKKFLEIAGQPRFQGWSLVGDYELGPKIPFFGQQLNYKLLTGEGQVEEYTSLLRHFGWVVAFGVTREGMVITLVQWKPGVNCPSWELPPGGIGRVKTDINEEDLLAKTKEAYLRETGYGSGDWTYLGHTLIETGKFRGANPEDHGLPAHMYVVTDLEQQAETRKPNANEIMETLLVPLREFRGVVMKPDRLFKETSALSCALLALAHLGL
ncbi:MAG: hypothetical protein KGZ30_02530 [Anaplasmataceae bacterium]|nr:hypothetical protein [Anaplasmataceae bacterium]